MIVCNNAQVRVEPLKVRISDFNKKEHRTRTFNIKSVQLDDKRSIVTIGNFDGEKQANDYITSMLMNEYVFGGIDQQNYSVLPISNKNYPMFYQAKDLDEYKKFVNKKK